MEKFYGRTGTLTFTDASVIIGRDTPDGRRLYGDAVEPREIPLGAVSGVAYKAAGWVKEGMFRVLVGGEVDESLDGFKSDDAEIIVGGGTNFARFEEAARLLRARAEKNHARAQGFDPAPAAAPPLTPGEQAEIARVRARDAAADRAAAEAKQAAAAGPKVESIAFGGKTVELYQSGYIRIGGAFGAADAPYETLRSIKFSFQVQDKSAGGRAMAGLATGGLNYLASKEKRTVFLTIATDRKVHTLQETGGMGRGADKRAMQLEALGESIINAARSPAVRQSPAPPAPAAAADDLAAQIGKLADLHAQGILSAEEFAAAKAKLLS